ncbi:EF-hand calcium-binding domain-containing protein 1 isoform X2 [Corapipo altera]|uniref:EF-hand calcium-binding domain-containing protein 1 isoform X2 n=1 Tax=Corapipo altera TaxID=415028 RepID=UPI000FD6B954|nr:EF-hand calcium-binding domain-containing protein 1 isoform X2 [Corapipo altera]
MCSVYARPLWRRQAALTARVARAAAAAAGAAPAAMSRKRLQLLAESLSRSTKHFSEGEVECLIKLFDALLARSSSHFAVSAFNRIVFRDTLYAAFGMTDDVVLDRDCFAVYDLNGDGYISREEMFQMLKDTLIKQPADEDPDEAIKDLVEIVLKKMDYDHDGKLSFADFEQAVKDENLLLEAFGPCLPDIKSRIAFEERVFPDTRKL